MNILFITPYLPSEKGGHAGAQLIYRNVIALSKTHNITVVSFEDNNEKMQNITSTVSIDSLLRINTMLSNYKVGSYNKDRTQIDFIGNNSFIDNISGRVNQVRSNNENFQTVYLNTKFLSGSIHPVINYVYERSDRSYHFQHLPLVESY